MTHSTADEPTLMSGGGPRGRPLPPGPVARYPGELFLALARDRMGFFRRVAAYGDAAQVRLGKRHVFLLRHPDLVRDVLVTHGRHFVKGRGLQRARLLLGDGLLTSEGDIHRRQRRLAQPAFHRQRIAGYARAMTAHAARAAERWRMDQAMDVHEEMMRLTLAIAAETLFDADIEGREAREIGRALADVIAAFEIAILPLTELLERFPLPWVKRFQRARTRLDATVNRIIAERRAAGGDRGDLLSMLLAARDEEGDGAGMTDLQLRDEVMTLLLAGHETTASALAWSWWLLATHPAERERMFAEVDAALGNAPAGMEDLARLPYTRAVLAEAMRLYPPAWVLGHQPVVDVEIGGWRVPAGSLCLLPQMMVHRDARWWPEPERFLPERWLAEQPADRPRFAYFPFGGGARQCIGEQFAWTEGVLVLATVAQRVRLDLAPDAPAVVPNFGFTLRPAGPVMMVPAAR